MKRASLPLLSLLVVSAILTACGGNPRVSDLGGDRKPTQTPSAGLHHPAGFAASTAHGLAAKLVTEDCRGCHGAQLQGGPDVSCDSCHVPGWRTSCTYCHGGADNATGAPPRDLTGAVQQDDLLFKSHTIHVQTTAIASPLECSSCHAASPVLAALDAGHWFDDTPGRAEVSFVNGLSSAGTYDAGIGRCSQLYCHGNGQGDAGVAAYDDGARTCDSCHRFTSQFGTMSGEHNRHMGADSTCNDCHGSTVTAAGVISTPALHVNGLRELSFPTSNVVWNAGAGSCTGTCHGENHQNEGW